MRLLQCVVLIGSIISDEGSKHETVAICSIDRVLSYQMKAPNMRLLQFVVLIGSIISDEGSKHETVAICGIDRVYHIR